jgi:hypothetical protein
LFTERKELERKSDDINEEKPFTEELL